MAVVSLELFKKHVRADDFSEDDAYLAHLIETASDAVIRATQRTEAELLEMGGGCVPLAIRQAALMLGAHWYNQRESATTAQMNEVPGSLQALIFPFRKLAHKCTPDE